MQSCVLTCPRVSQRVLAASVCSCSSSPIPSPSQHALSMYSLPASFSFSAADVCVAFLKLQCRLHPPPQASKPHALQQPACAALHQILNVVCGLVSTGVPASVVVHDGSHARRVEAVRDPPARDVLRLHLARAPVPHAHLRHALEGHALQDAHGEAGLLPSMSTLAFYSGA